MCGSESINETQRPLARARFKSQGRGEGGRVRMSRAQFTGERSPRANQCERVDVPSNQSTQSAVAGHPDGCPAVGAPRPRSPAFRAARPRAPRRAQGSRARRSSQGERTKGNKSPGTPRGVVDRQDTHPNARRKVSEGQDGQLVEASSNMEPGASYSQKCKAEICWLG